MNPETKALFDKVKLAAEKCLTHCEGCPYMADEERPCAVTKETDIVNLLTALEPLTKEETNG